MSVVNLKRLFFNSSIWMICSLLIDPLPKRVNVPLPRDPLDAGLK